MGSTLFCRSGSWVFGCKTAMPSVRRGAIWLVLSTRRARRGRCGSHELDRRAIYGDAFLRKSEDGCVFELPWSLCESEAGSKTNAGDGDSRDMPWARNPPTQNGSCGVSVNGRGKGGIKTLFSILKQRAFGRQWFTLFIKRSNIEHQNRFTWATRIREN